MNNKIKNRVYMKIIHYCNIYTRYNKIIYMYIIRRINEKITKINITIILILSIIIRIMGV